MKSFSRLRPLVLPMALGLTHLALLYVLDATRVIGRLLGAVRPSVALALLVVVFFVLRLMVFFVVPGWLLIAVVEALRGSKTARNRVTDAQAWLPRSQPGVTHPPSSKSNHSSTRS